jgi:hypothetical protein
MQYFFISQLASITTQEDMNIYAVGYKCIHFWALLRCVDACLDLGMTCAEQCANTVSETYIKLIFCLGLPLEKFRESMQHPQSSTFPVWLPAIMWKMSKNYRTKFKNAVLVYFDTTGSDQTWLDGNEITCGAYCWDCATKCNNAEVEKGK